MRSEPIAHLFSQHATNYQAMAAQAAAFNDQFVQHLTAGAGSYASAEAANVALLQPLTAIAGAVESSLIAFIGSNPLLLNPISPLIAAVGISLFIGFLVALFLFALVEQLATNPLSLLSLL